jgi:retron-type reverse transcriptase
MGRTLEANLQSLHQRVHSGAYRASPSRRAYIPKADGRLRPLGIATLEDKIVQRAVVEVLNAIFEEDFLGFSYDRLLHHAHLVATEGPSVRLEEALAGAGVVALTHGEAP